ncbi:uncharacterized protein CTHT_0000160 [Thermochaetoides thermophila DSM 1495]|uniref:Increased loss of mitochondrial DNA protein 1 n=1 Tax=Chaetomium thermophilum (strain DSM 1495 / CBS 144.50 / IMI 039719) TaxID=759272 RepID=G0RXR9_CHATD|nr:hypothetical protein CTHT_0000160 [Thermochaetoides thermophila DSM 1495]EGS24085.1 hypothetical protein CTHT_0000160 [Thermochaetoides thermophila DSM 1495]
MALISARTIITSLSLFHLTLAFFFLTNPAAVSDQAVVYLLGESMGLPHSRSFDAQSPSLAFLAVILGLFGLCDLVTLSLPDEICIVHHWGVQAPLRLTISLLLSAYSFFLSPSSPFFYTSPKDFPPYTSDTRAPFAHPSVHHATHNPAYIPSGWGGDALKNRVFFTFMFVETMGWFWALVTLREEQREILEKKERQRQRRRSSGSGSGFGNFAR